MMVEGYNDGRIAASGDRATHERSQSSLSSPSVGIPCAWTPGPWKFEAGEYGHIVTWCGASIAAVWPSTLGNAPLPSKANARLIAAAPDLYEALYAILAEAERMSMTRRRRRIFNNGQAALAKARGEA